MPKQVDVPGMGTVEFPDGMTDDQIVSAIRKNSMQPKQGFLQNAWQALTSPAMAGGPMAAIGRKGFEEVNKGIEGAAYGAGGGVTDVLAGNVPPEVAGGAGYLTNVGSNLAASLLLGKGASTVAKPIMESAARRTMQAAVKPLSKDIETGKAARAIETMLKEDVGANQAGVARLKIEVAKLEDEIERAVRGSKAMINKAAVGGRLKDALDKFKMQVNPESDMEAIRKAWVEFRNHPLLQGKTDFPVQIAQSMKRGTYRSLGDKPYGELQGATKEAQKALARGLKEEIGAAIPGVSALNARQGDLLNAAKIANRRALVAGNNNLLGLSPIAPNTASMLAFLADRSPTAASYLARILYSNAGAIPAGAANAAALPLLLESARPPALLEQY